MRWMVYCQVLWTRLLQSTTPLEHRGKSRMRSRYQRLLWALIAVSFFFLLTVLLGGGDTSTDNAGLMFYLVMTVFMALLGYLSGLYLSWWLRRLSPFYHLRARPTRSTKKKS